MSATAEPAPSPPPQPSHRRSPIGAALLSIALNGLGHLYAGRPRRGAVWYAGLFVAGLACLALAAWTSFGLPLFVIAMLGGTIAAAVDAGITAARAPQPYQLRRYNSWVVYVGLIIGAQFLGSGVKAVVNARIDTFRIPTAAMAPTIDMNEFIIVEKGPRARNGITRGSLVVFEWLIEYGTPYVKRVVGVAGDTLRMEKGILYRSGSRVDEPYLHAPLTDVDTFLPEMEWQLPRMVGGAPAGYKPSMRTWGPIVVPPDSMFVLGDNRDDSMDSRMWGFIGRDRIIGRAIRIYYSYDAEDGVIPWLTAIRWERVGRELK